MLTADSELLFPHDYKSPLPKCVIRVDNNWYDVTTWRHSHPGGAQLCDMFHNADATDAFYSLHSEEAIAKLQRMKGKPVDPEVKRDEISLKFEAFKEQLEKEGWFQRKWGLDLLHGVMPCVTLCLLGTMLAYSYPVIATLMIGLGMQQAGWCGHDYVHGRGTLSALIGDGLGAFINGFSSRWWSNKHNTHHTFPNRKTFDSDVHNEPIIHLWFPDASKDVWYRKYQHIYFPLAYSLLYVSWRMQSLQFVLGSRNWVERSMIAVNYIWLACLPWKVAIASIILGGFFVAIVVTANHQTEEMLEPEEKYNFIVDQTRTTRGIFCPDPVSEFFFGGMNYQLEHHMFPIMPRYYYPKLRPIVKKWCEENGLQHHVSSIPEIFRLNIEVMKKFSGEGPKSKTA